MITDGGQNIIINLVASILAEADSLKRNEIEKDAMQVLNRLLGVRTFDFMLVSIVKYKF